MNIDTTRKKKSRRNPKTARPLKKLLSPLPPLPPEKHSIFHHRHSFLKELRHHCPLPFFNDDLWSGTALHLLLLTDIITPDMYQAANTYLNLMRKNLSSGPKLSQVPLDENLGTFERKPFAHVPLPFLRNEEKWEKEEKLWRDLNRLLIETNSKILLDSLIEDSSLSSLKDILKDERQTKRIQKGLDSLRGYLEE